MIKIVKLRCHHESEGKAKAHSELVKSKNPNKVIDSGFDGKTSWFEMENYDGYDHNEHAE